MCRPELTIRRWSGFTKKHKQNFADRLILIGMAPSVSVCSELQKARGCRAITGHDAISFDPQITEQWSMATLGIEVSTQKDLGGNCG